MNTDHLAQWPTKAGVAARLAISEKTVERYSHRGMLKSRMRAVPGRRSEPVYDPADVEKLASQKEADETSRLSEVLTEPASAGSVNRDLAMARAAGRELTARPELTIMAIEKIASMGEGIAQATEAVGIVVEELASAVRQLSAIRERESADAEKRAVVDAGKMVLTIKEAATLGFRLQALRQMVREGTLVNFGTASRPRVSRRALEEFLAGGSNADQKRP